MKQLQIAGLTCLLLILCSFNYNNKRDRLCRENEEVVFSFLLKSNHKIVSVCKDTNNKYIVYRFGTIDKIEFEYPAQRDETSWSKFKYYYVHRGGGKANAGMGDISLSFTNNNVSYSVYHSWSDEEATNDVGVEVRANGEITNLKGSIDSQKGALQSLDAVENKITNTAEE